MMKLLKVALPALLLLFVFSGAALAGPQVIGDRYFANNIVTPDPGSYDPSWNGSAWDWPPAYDLDSLIGETLDDGNYLLLGLENYYIDETYIKSVTVLVTYTTTGGVIQFADAAAGIDAHAPPTIDLPPKETIVDNGGGSFTYIATFSIIPQPDWEWVLLQNIGGGAINITDAAITTVCARYPVTGTIPSLTEWGMIALVLLMLAAGALVIARRRRVVI